jgi:hypothetical protein
MDDSNDALLFRVAQLLRMLLQNSKRTFEIQN